MDNLERAVTYYDFSGRPVDASMTRADLEELLATLEKRASTERDEPTAAMFKDQAELVREVLQ